jgi:hypothetical protein
MRINRKQLNNLSKIASEQESKLEIIREQKRTARILHALPRRCREAARSGRRNIVVFTLNSGQYEVVSEKGYKTIRLVNSSAKSVFAECQKSGLRPYFKETRSRIYGNIWRIIASW